MSLQRFGIFPLLDEHHPEIVLDVTVNAVQQASRLLARTPDVRQAQLQDSIDRVRSGFDTAGHDHHAMRLSKKACELPFPLSVPALSARQ